MFAELALATVMVMLIVTIHAAGLFGLTRLLRLEGRAEAIARIHSMSPRGFAATIVAITASSSCTASRFGFMHSCAS